VGKRFESTQRAYEDLAGPRRRQLQRSLDKVDALRRERGLEPLIDDGDVDDRPALRAVSEN
jgi:hypothetical protein